MINAISVGFMAEIGRYTGPKLRSVTLSGHWNTDKLITQCAPQLTALTDLKIKLFNFKNDGTDPFDADLALKLLGALPQLVKASFLLHASKRSAPFEGPPITLPHLEFLSLQGAPIGPEFARSLNLPSLNTAYLVFDAYQPPGDDPNAAVVAPPTPYAEGILEFLRIFGSQLKALALNPEPFNLASFPPCLDTLNTGRLETLSLIDKQFPAPQGHFPLYEADARQQLDIAALRYLTNPSVLPKLKYFEMAARNPRFDVECDLAVVEAIAARRRVRGEGRASVVGPDLEEYVAQSRCCIQDVHIAFSWWTHMDIVEVLKGRGVDLESKPFAFRLDYPESRRQSIGQLSARPWGEWK